MNEPDRRPFVELRAAGVALRVPPWTGDAPPAWVIEALTSLVLQGERPLNTAYGPRHRIPVSMSVHGSGGLAAFLFTEHPNAPDVRLAVGITEAERRRSHRSTPVLLRLLAGCDPHLVTDPDRPNRFDDPAFEARFASSAARLELEEEPGFAVREVGAVHVLTIPKRLRGTVRELPMTLALGRSVSLSDGGEGPRVRIVAGAPSSAVRDADGTLVVTLEPAHVNRLDDWAWDAPIAAGPIVVEPLDHTGHIVIARANPGHTLLQTVGLGRRGRPELSLRWPLHRWLGDGRDVLDAAVALPGATSGAPLVVDGQPDMVLAAREGTEPPMLEVAPREPWSPYREDRDEAFEAALRAHYGGTEPAARLESPFDQHFWSPIDVLPPLRRVLTFDVGDHWHVVSVGGASIPTPDGTLGQERSIRVAKQGQATPPQWAMRLLLWQMQSMAARGAADPLLAIATQPVPVDDGQPPLLPVILVDDPVLGTVDTSEGPVRVVQTVLISAPEALRAALAEDDLTNGVPAVLAARTEQSEFLVSGLHNHDGAAPPDVLRRLLASPAATRMLADAEARDLAAATGGTLAATRIVMKPPRVCVVEVTPHVRDQMHARLRAGLPATLTAGTQTVTFKPTDESAAGWVIEVAEGRAVVEVSPSEVTFNATLDLPVAFGPFVTVFPALPTHPVERLHELAYLSLHTNNTASRLRGSADKSQQSSLSCRSVAARTSFLGMLMHFVEHAPGARDRFGHLLKRSNQSKAAACLLLAGPVYAFDTADHRYARALVAWIDTFAHDPGVDPLRALAKKAGLTVQPPSHRGGSKPNTDTDGPLRVPRDNSGTWLVLGLVVAGAVALWVLFGR